MVQPTSKRLVTEATLNLALDAGFDSTLQESKDYTNTLAFGTALEVNDAAIASLIEGPSDTDGALRATYGGIDTPDLTMVVSGAAGDGVTDDSEAWIATINAVGDAGGGVVTAPRNRTYIVQNLPIREDVWLDLKGITLKHPVNPTAPMFSAAPAAKFAGGGITGGEMIGYNKMQHCIDFSQVTTLEHFIIENTYVHDFNRGYNGSQNDRFPMLRDTKFWFNSVGAYVYMNHPIIHFCDFRNNDVGVTGNLNDVYFLGCKFNFNRVGVQPDQNDPNAIISNTRFVGCAFARNTEKGLVITHFNSVTSCQFYGNNSNDDGLTILWGDNTIVSNLFGYMTEQGSWGGACIRYASTVTMRNNIIAHNNFQLISPTGVGIAAAAGTVGIENAVIDGNTFAVSHATKAISLTNVRLTAANIVNNTFLVSATSTHVAGTGIAEFSDLGTGCDFLGNTFTSSRANTPVSAFKFGSISGCIFNGNRFRGFSTPISATFWDNSQWGVNHGFITEASNLTSIPAGATSVTVTHGLNHPSAGTAKFISVNPTNDMSVATKFWVSNVTATTFDIRVNTAPTAYAANFRWAIRVP